MRGRKKLTSPQGLGVEVWLKSYLSGGRRSSVEVIEVAKRQGFGLSTLKKAKTQLGIVSDHGTGGSLWYWRDPSVSGPEVNSKDKNPMTAGQAAELSHKIEEFTRIAQAPRIMTDDGPIVAPDPSEVDALGYKKHFPPGLGATIKVNDVLSEIRRLTNEGLSHEEFTSHIFAYAYPAAGISESILAQMLKANGILVPSRVPQKSGSEARIEF